MSKEAREALNEVGEMLCTTQCDWRKEFETIKQALNRLDELEAREAPVKPMIISGFAGIGKSTLAKQGVLVDLESTPFNKNWKLYADVAEHMLKNGYFVAISAHKEIRKELESRLVPFIFIKPRVEDKGIYLQRYRDRGNTEDFINLMDKNWEFFTEQAGLENYAILRENEYLSDWIKRSDKE